MNNDSRCTYDHVIVPLIILAFSVVCFLVIVVIVYFADEVVNSLQYDTTNVKNMHLQLMFWCTVEFM